MDTVNTELIRGHVDTIILRSLLDGDRYPYDILKEISERSEGRYELKQPTLYSCMKRLEKQGLISSYWGSESDGGRRRYYSLTENGRMFLLQDQTEWEYSRTIIDKLLSDKPFDLQSGVAPFEASDLRPLTRRNVTPRDEESEASPAEATPRTLDESQETTTVLVSSATSDKPTQLSDDVLVSKPYMMHRDANQSMDAQSIESEVAPLPTPVTTADLEAEAKLRAASKKLGIGAYAQVFTWDNEGDSPVPISPSMPQEPSNTSADSTATVVAPQQTYIERPVEMPQIEDANYRKRLDGLYSKPSAPGQATSEVPTAFAPQASSYGETSARQFNDLKTSLLQEGYRLRSYSRPNAMSQQFMRYLYDNKIKRDSYLILFVVMLAEFILTLVLKVFGSLAWLYALLGVSICAVPAIALFAYSKNPGKRVRSNFNFGYSLVVRMVFSLLIVLVFIGIFLLVPTIDINFGDAAMYIPIIFALDLPIFALIYSLLYKSGKYHLNKK